MKTLKLLALCLLPALAVSCHKDPVPQPKTEVVELDNNIDDTQFDDNIALVGPECEHFAKFRSRGLVTDQENAQVIIIDQKSLEAYKDDVDKAFNEGKFIIVCDYKHSDFQPLQQEKGWLCAVPEGQSFELLGFSKYGILVLVDNGEEIEIKDPELTPDSDGTNTIPSVVPPAEDDNVIENYVYKKRDPLESYVGAFINELNGMKDKFEKTPIIEKDVLFVSLLMKWKVKLLFAQTALSNWDYVEGTYQAASRYRIMPLYAFSKNASPGDYYIMDVDYVSMPSDVWKGDDQIRTHGLVDVHFTGAFVRKFRAETSISSNNISFIQASGPYPTTFIGSAGYSRSISWQNDGGIVSGLLFPDTGIYSKPRFSWGTKNTRTISIVQNDWQVKQTTLDHTPSWEWESQNLPKKNGKRHFSRKCPPIACGAAPLPAHWVWRYTGDIGEWSDKSVGTIVTKLHPILGIQRNGYWYSYEEYVYDIKEQSLTIQMPVPQRIPFGTFLLHNNFKEGTIMSGVTVKDAAGKVFFTSKGDFRYDTNCEVSVEEGEYDVYFTIWDGAEKKDFKSNKKIKVSRRDVGEKPTVYEASGSGRFDPVL